MVLRGAPYPSRAFTVRLPFLAQSVSGLTPVPAFPLASYDYGASITENRELTPKYDELKLQGLFLRSSPEFYKTDWIGNSSTTSVTVSNSAAFVVKLVNPDTTTGFYIARQNDSTSTFVISLESQVEPDADVISLVQQVQVGS